MPAYDRGYSPPAPVADVMVMHPVSGLRRRSLRGKLDSGADTTAIPEAIASGQLAGAGIDVLEQEPPPPWK